ncbi:uncharacterized protein F4822DRAFT_421823 [Hypoxylon trugodes]|uniref:uncharacterized protein n=1 Tax=Hypoxylon trugodes TaxID=326681 RepID=UPI0021988183|nr:uncharacterized protein F4822DRAFT_421823 [Hypoxylon trugodes]KAI1383008.1 hypothetical protein F4822DRAFT_421823 [Hypoxylon trugodes]
MAPSLHRRMPDDAFDTHIESETRNDDADWDAMEPWLIAVIVLASLTAISLIILGALYLARRRQRTERESKEDPLHQRDHKRRKLSDSDRMAAEELERAQMIRKSLASRTSSHGEIEGHRHSRMSDYEMEEADHSEREPMAPRDNWKDWEAGSQAQRPIPGVQDLEMGVHPALLPQPHPQLVISHPSRSPSPARGITPPRLYIPS